MWGRCFTRTVALVGTAVSLLSFFHWWSHAALVHIWKCFLGVSDLDGFNRAVMAIVQAKGDVYMTSTQLNGVFVLRANIINFRTSEADLDFLLDAVEQAAAEVMLTL